MSKNNKIIMLENNSEWYEKAIFILKENVKPPKITKDLVMEAERIIQNYAVKYNYKVSTDEKNKVEEKSKCSNSNNKKTNRSIDRALNICLILSIILCFYFLANIM